MPPKVRITKEEIISAALELVREKGAAVLNARTLAAAMGCSTQPIFSSFASMDEVRAEVIAAGYMLHEKFLTEAIAKNEYPPYKASGMAYIRFAREERELFKLLFMRDRTVEGSFGASEETEMVISIIQNALAVSRERAELFHLEMWIFVHGIATMLATSYFDINEELISEMLTDMYEGLKKRFSEKEGKQCLR